MATLPDLSEMSSRVCDVLRTKLRQLTDTLSDLLRTKQAHQRSVYRFTQPLRESCPIRVMRYRHFSYVLRSILVQHAAYTATKSHNSLFGQISDRSRCVADNSRTGGDRIPIAYGQNDDNWRTNKTAHQALNCLR